MKRADGDEETFRFSEELKMSLELLMTVREAQHEMELLRCKFRLSTVVVAASVEGKRKRKGRPLGGTFFGGVESGSSRKSFSET